MDVYHTAITVNKRNMSAFHIFFKVLNDNKSFYSSKSEP